MKQPRLYAEAMRERFGWLDALEDEAFTIRTRPMRVEDTESVKARRRRELVAAMSNDKDNEENE